MKMKKLVCILFAFMFTVCCFAGCSAESPTNLGAEKPYYGGVYDSVGEDVAVTAPAGSSTGDLSGSAGVQNQKLIRTVTVEAETDDLDGLLSTLQARIAALNGYIEQQTIRDRSSSRYADMTIRVPVSHMDAFIEHISGASNVTYYQESADDVTLQYVATESRITALETERDRLLALMEKAANMSDLLQIEKRLTEVLTELEEATSQLRLYDNLVDYGTIHLYVSQVVEFTVVEEQDVWQRIATGFGGNMKALGDGIVEAFVAVVIAIPYMIPFAVAGIVVLVLVKIQNKKKKAKEAQSPKTDEK